MKNNVLSALIVFQMLIFGNILRAQDLSEYSLSTGIDSTKWISISTGATQIFGANVNNVASPILNIGFNFRFGSYTTDKFSVNGNGVLRLGNIPIESSYNAGSFSSYFYSDNTPKISAYASYTSTGPGGYVKYKVVGSAPNRTLVVECRLENPITNLFQIQLNETSNKITFVYNYNHTNQYQNYSYMIGIGDSISSVVVNTTADTAIYCTNGHSNSYYNLLPQHKYYEFSPNFPSCTRPIYAYVYNTTDTTVTIFWDTIGSTAVPIKYLIEYGRVGFQPGSGIKRDTIGSVLSYTFQNLEPSSGYDVYLRAVCNNGDTSSTTKTRIFTRCNTQQRIPFYDDFEMYQPVNSAPSCNWYNLSNGSSYATVSNSDSHSGNQCIYHNSYSNRYTYFTTYEIDVNTTPIQNLRTSFYVKGNSNRTAIIVGVMNKVFGFSSPDISSFYPVDTIFTYGTEWNQEFVSLENYPTDSSGSFVAFLIKQFASGYSSNIYLDDIALEDVSQCIQPQNFDLYSIRPNEVTLGWKYQNNAEWEVAYDIGNFDPELAINSFITTDTTATITDLVTDSTYYFYIRSVCDNNTSLWQGPLVVTEGKINMKFIDQQEIVVCDSKVEYNHTASLSNLQSILTLRPPTEFDLLEIDGFITLANNEEFRIYDGADTTAQLIFNSKRTTYVHNIISSSGPLTLVFKSNTVNNNRKIALNVRCIDLYSCYNIREVKANEISTRSALVSWAFAQARNQEYPYSVIYQILDNNGTIVDSGRTTNTYTLFSNLQPNTFYTIRAKTLCNDYNENNWKALEIKTLYCTTNNNIQLGLGPDFNTSIYQVDGREVCTPIPANIRCSTASQQSTNLPYSTGIYNLSQQIVLAREMLGAATIKTIYFDFASMNGDLSDYVISQKNNCDIYMAHISDSMHTTLVPFENMKLVYSGNLNMRYGWNSFTLDSVFHYNGTDNLAIIIDDNSGATLTASSFNGHQINHYSLSKYSNTDIPPSTTSNFSVNYRRNNMILEMECNSTDTCSPPQLYIANRDTNKIDIIWAAGYNGTSWILEYKEEGTTAWQIVDTINTTNYSIGGLNANTAYNIRLTAMCGNNNISTIKTAYTACDAIEILPYYINFDDMAVGEISSNCIVTLSSYPEEYTPTVITSTNTISRPNALNIKSNTDQYSAIVLPSFTEPIINLILSAQFGYSIGSPDTMGNIMIGVMTNPYDIATFEQVASFRPRHINNITNAIEVSFENYSGEGRYIALITQNTTSNFLIDDIEVTTNTNCKKATNITISNITTTTATIQWVDSVAIGWIIEYGPRGFNRNSSEGQRVSTIYNPHVLQNLESNTNYDLYIYSICFNGDTSLYSTKCQFRTDCSSILNVPYLETFDEYNLVTRVPAPDCWHYGCNYSNQNSYPYIDNTHDANNIGGSIRLGAFKSNYVNNYSYFALLPIDSNSYNVREYMVNFKMMGVVNTNQNNNNRVIVGVMRKPDSISTFVGIDTIECTANLGVWETFEEIELYSYIGQGKYIAFLAQGDLNGYIDICIDDIEVDLIPNCYKPTLPYISDVSSTTSTIGWNERNSPPAQSWIIEYGPDGFAVGTGTQQVATSNPYTISGLQPRTVYNFYVRSVCIYGDTSYCSDVVQLRTTQEPANIPYNYNFETQEEWGKWEIASNTYTQWAKGNATSWSGEEAMYVSTDNGTTNSTQNLIVNAVAYRDFYVGNIDTTLVITFSAKAGGNTSSNTDGLAVFVASPSQVVESSAQHKTSPWGHLDSINLIGQPIRLDTNFNTYSYEIHDVASTIRVVFFYYNKNGGNYIGKPAAVDDISIDYAECPFPRNLQINDITSSSAQATWTGSASGYYIYYKKSDQPNYDSAYTQATHYNLYGLEQDSPYMVKVKAVCQNGTHSIHPEPIYFTTTQPLAQLPYYCSFEENEGETALWSIKNGNATNKWCIDTAEKRVGQYGLYISTDSGTTYQVDKNSPSVIWAYRDFYFPTIPDNENFVLSFSWKCYSSFPSNYSTEVYISSPDTVVAGNITEVIIPSNAELLANLHHEVVFVLEQIELSGEKYGGKVNRIYFCWKNIPNYYNVTILPPAIDDIEIISPVAGCVIPQVTVDTSYYSVTINWYGTEEHHLVYKRATSEEWSNEIVVNDSSYTITNLEPNTTYDYKVYKKCDGINSSRTIIGSFKTHPLPCLPAENIEVSNITFKTATLSWDYEIDNNQLWEVYYGYNTEFSTWDTITTFTPTVNLDNLYYDALYNVHIRSYCNVDSNFYSDIAIQSFHTDSCAGVSNVVVGHITDNSAIITWTPQQGQNQWEIAVALEGVDEQNSEKINVTETPSYQVTNLIYDTIYDVYVRNICDSGIYSDWTPKVQFRSKTGSINTIGNSATNIVLYPNPADNETTIYTENISGAIEVSITNISGKKVYNNTIVCDGILQHSIDLKDYTPGMFFLNIKGKNIDHTEKLIVN